MVTLEEMVCIHYMKLLGVSHVVSVGSGKLKGDVHTATKIKLFSTLYINYIS